MWTTTKTLNAKIKPRPGRIAYLVPSPPPHKLLDAIIEECLGRWGGRRTPIIPSDGKTISPAYWALLDLWDADIIYSYIPLTENLEKRLFHLFAPSEIIDHENLDSATSHHDFRPELSGNYTFLSSLSVVPLFSRRANIDGADIPLILDGACHQVEDSDIADTFGFVSRSCVGERLLPQARRISVKKPKKEITDSFREPSEITYVDNIDTLIEQIAKNRNLLSLGRLSDMFCPFLNNLAKGKQSWEDHLTIVIGDEVDDRLLFWNAQHRYRSFDSHSDLSVLRISPTRLINGVPDWLRDWISIRNHRHLNGNSAPRAVIRSCSISQEKLDLIAADLQGTRMIMVSAEHMASPCLFNECPEDLLQSRTGPYAAFPSHWIFPNRDAEETIRFRSNELGILLTPPWHLQFSSSSALTAGIWAIDLEIERAENHSPYSFHQQIWKFPRRLRTEQALTFENYHTGGMGLILPPNHRPTESGDLVVWDALSWPRPILSLPSDLNALAQPLVYFTYASPGDRQASDNGSPRGHYSRVSVGDKGRDLLGVFQLFANLPEALLFLTDPVWLSIIEYLLPKAPEDSSRSRKELTSRLQELIKPDKIPGDPDFDNIARRALQCAGQTIAAQSQNPDFANFETLLNEAKKGVKKDKSKLDAQLSASAEYLRNRGFLWQGHGWRCETCQHNNWVNLDRLEPVSKCEICRKKHPTPVSTSLDLRLNPFVEHAFSPASGQKPVIWCLSKLLSKAHHSFMWFPALLLHEHGSADPKTDIDIIAAIDGKVYLVEVKTQFSGVSKSTVQKTEKLAKILRPDIAMIAVADKKETCSGQQNKWFDDCRDQLLKIDVCFELLSKEDPSDNSEQGNVAQAIGEKLEWVGW